MNYDRDRSIKAYQRRREKIRNVISDKIDSDSFQFPPIDETKDMDILYNMTQKMIP